ncbi:RNA degradosome polyphosphate kinase [Sporomusa acidovorans]|uniref:Polyphosphate kinase n=1 Tax=Sporomusa acidovorans (strain ATCC 49682 / DSM 3132 / Mol) TaxID=1123286 RepID=A0ABZ3JAB5_SPOA4|nr:RNA degradosome polyphosphate kinase [Sporomusa acidovorans]OZC13311.1 polyphosphate kinase [Sporomusa acidovorans DSM 3132]SDD97059.1 polyphosphate kinase [Sporomusa acidovorans]
MANAKNNHRFDDPDYFFNRELSWLKFNRRVLGEADVKHKPLLERLKFIAISSSNLDEFFMIRVAGLKHQLESGVNKVDAAGLSVRQQLVCIAEDTHELVKLEYRFLKNIQAELEEADICFCDSNSLDEWAQEWIENFFDNTIFPVITPMAVDAGHPFPFLTNRSLNLAVLLCQDRSDDHAAVIQVPAVLPRIIEAPSNGTKRQFVFLEDIIKRYCGKLFHGYTIKDVVPFRITRNADLSIDEEDAEDLLAEIEKSLRQRKHGQAVRLEIGKTNNRPLRELLVHNLNIEEQDIYEINGPLDTTCFFKFSDIPGLEYLLHCPVAAQIPRELIGVTNLFDTIRERDILLHHPYESFQPVVEFVRQAACDPDVLAIKQTLYRVSGNSPIVKSLAQAAENGKQVTVLVELKARFDEENNILWAKQLEEAGCHVIYGLVGLKTHAKMILVVRQEQDGIKRYIHMGTGNYNDATAKIYTDMGLFTANDQFGADASAFFNVLSGYSDPPVWNKIVVAPLGLREKIKELIDREMEFVKAGKKGRIIAKMNSLVDRDIVLKLYEASCQGVKIDLIIRGICVLRPGVPGVSENISVRSIVGRFLEHHRIFYFSNGGDERVFLSSADWMPRNLNERVELFFPIEDTRQIARIKDILDITLEDNQKAYIMKKDGTYRRVDKRGKAVNSQMEFYAEAQTAAREPDISIEQRLKPLYRRAE